MYTKIPGCGSPAAASHAHGAGATTSECAASATGERTGSGFCAGTFGSLLECATTSTGGRATRADARRSPRSAAASEELWGGAAPGRPSAGCHA